MAISKSALKNLRDTYIDTFIIIYLKDLNIVTVDQDGQEAKISLMCEGLVLDIDQEFIYLGDESGASLKTVPHGSIGLIEMATFEPDFMDFDISNEEIH